MHTEKSGRFDSIPTATGGIARLACARLRELGKAVAAVVSRAGLTPEEVGDPAIRLEVHSQIKLLELAAEELEDELLGFHLARSFDLREIGLVYYVIASSEHLADALRNAERYSRIMNEGVRLRFGLHDRTATIALDYVNVDRHADRQHIEFWLVTLIRICRKVTDGRLAPSSLKMKHVRNGMPAEFRTFFGSDIEFGADADAISFPEAIALLPLVGRDGYLNELLRQYAEEALAHKPRERPTLRSKVEEVLPNLLPHGRAVASHVAPRLAMSSRTLSRKLGEEGTSFGEILDGFRSALAKRYLDDERLPVSEVAWLLGYREVSSLTHAFKRWTGMTPRQFRLARPDSTQA
ncbi:MAG: AraC family transcriptional regulator ligand-binding domain-containing protein [Bradyrhizobium sp.]|uniref:AraC family transcriptional regulator n=1 Tax=Bradyrhizobium sp. TaxID=376 RepID=UPI0025C70C8C|nr:AraC family transcriptional regulator [Bradyrhizobium sp.]MBI5260203.1 AraC family transcriptional regulator ligand-binding domain-containing protein [Bradyrhizobium sp.]